ncbi:MAG: RHS repeat-associated core domain-containing protein [Alphaproteobacteria bacterium]
MVKTLTYLSTSNRVQTEIRPGATRTFAYDAIGNVTQDAQGGSSPTHDLIYNHAGRLKQVTVNGTPTTEYALNAIGERVVKQPYGSPSSGTHYHYALDAMLLAESTAAGAASEEYIVLPDSALPLAVVSDPQGAPATLAFVHADHVGASQKITNGAKVAVWDLLAGPFGELESITGSLAHNPRFPGQYADVETGYRYNDQRDYDPSIGRYLQSDPIGPAGGLNTYGYVEGNPINLVDPTGEFAFVPFVIAALVGAGSGAGIEFGFQMFEDDFELECIDLTDLAIAAALGATGGVAGGARTFIKRAGAEWSHWIPGRFARPSSKSFKSWLPRGLVSGPYNRNAITPRHHFRIDPYRYPGKDIRKGADRYGIVQRQMYRVPYWLDGVAIGTAGGVVNGRITPCPCE